MRPIHRQSSEISAEMNTSPRTYLPSLPSDFHLSPSHHDCHYPTPSRSPTLFSPTLHSSVNSPLASYATTRQRYRILVQPEDTEQLQRAQVSKEHVSLTLSVLVEPSMFSYLGFSVSSVSNQCTIRSSRWPFQIHHQDQVCSSACTIYPSTSWEKRHSCCPSTHRQVLSLQKVKSHSLRFSP